MDFPETRRKSDAIQWLVKTVSEGQLLQQGGPIHAYQGLVKSFPHLYLEQASRKPSPVLSKWLVEAPWETNVF